MCALSLSNSEHICYGSGEYLYINRESNQEIKKCQGLRSESCSIIFTPTYLSYIQKRGFKSFRYRIFWDGFVRPVLSRKLYVLFIPGQIYVIVF